MTASSNQAYIPNQPTGSGMTIPLQVEASDTWIVEAVARLRNAASEPTPPPEGKLQRLRWQPPSPLTLEARRLETDISSGLPPALKDTFSVGFNEADFESNPALFPVKLIGLATSSRILKRSFVLSMLSRGER